MHVSGMIHVNINCSNFERSRSFYETLGFRVVWQVPPTNSREVAAAVGMPPYKVNGALMALEGSEHPVVIDLLEWQSPHDDSPPYAHLYHYGLARLALSTSDMDADLATLESMALSWSGRRRAWWSTECRAAGVLSASKIRTARFWSWSSRAAWTS